MVLNNWVCVNYVSFFRLIDQFYCRHVLALTNRSALFIFCARSKLYSQTLQNV